MFERRLKVFLGILAAVVVLLLGRAAQLQVAQGDEWRNVANESLKKTSFTEASRGAILDRTGRELARDRACSDACVIYYALTPKADPTWLNSIASGRVRLRMGDAFSHAPKADRQKLVQQELQAVQAEIDAMWGKLARISGQPLEEIERVRQSICQRVEMRKKYIWYQTYLRAAKSSGGVDEAEPRWQRWLSGQTDDAPEIDKFAVTVGEEKQVHVILHDISLDVQNELGRHPEQFPGLVVRPGQKRYYPNNEVAAQLLGRVGKVNREDIENDPYHGDPRRQYLPNDDIGRTGLEALGEPSLRGVMGSIVTIQGETTSQPAQTGQDLRATIDVALQRDIQKFFANATLHVKKTVNERTVFEDVPNQVLHGAAVLLDVKTNQVLALVSYPTFNLNTQDELLQVLLDDQIDAPMRNLQRTETQFEPGSTVKPLVGLAGITAGVVKVTEGIECKGFLELPDRRSGKMVRYGHIGRCWVASSFADILKGDQVMHHQVPWSAPHHGIYGNQDGFLTYSDGLERSCNVYFETVADRLGIDALSDWMMRFGLGRKTGIGIHEFTGKVPMMARDNFGVPRRTIGFLGGIGQMNVLVTPLQMANVASTIARGGIWMRPRLVMPDPKTGQDPTLKDGAIDVPDRIDLHLDPEAVKACRLGMYNVVNSPGGTGTTARMDDLSVAGKTGTAQASPFRFPKRDPVTRKVIRDSDGKVEYETFEPSTPEKPNPQVPWYRGTTGTDHTIIDHSWMIGFAPADNPKIAYGVLVEYGGSGGGAAADVVRTALEACIKHGYLNHDVNAPTTEPSTQPAAQ